MFTQEGGLLRAQGCERWLKSEVEAKSGKDGGMWTVYYRSAEETGTRNGNPDRQRRMENGKWNGNRQRRMENGMETGSGEWKMEREMEAGRMALVGHRTFQWYAVRVPSARAYPKYTRLLS